MLKNRYKYREEYFHTTSFLLLISIRYCQKYQQWGAGMGRVEGEYCRVAKASRLAIISSWVFHHVRWHKGKLSFIFLMDYRQILHTRILYFVERFLLPMMKAWRRKFDWFFVPSSPQDSRFDVKKSSVEVKTLDCYIERNEMTLWEIFSSLTKMIFFHFPHSIWNRWVGKFLNRSNELIFSFFLLISCFTQIFSCW